MGANAKDPGLMRIPWRIDRNSRRLMLMRAGGDLAAVLVDGLALPYFSSLMVVCE